MEYISSEVSIKPFGQSSNTYFYIYRPLTDISAEIGKIEASIEKHLHSRQLLQGTVQGSMKDLVRFQSNEEKKMTDKPLQKPRTGWTQRSA